LINISKNLDQVSSTSDLEDKIDEEYQNYLEAKRGIPSFLRV